MATPHDGALDESEATQTDALADAAGGLGGVRRLRLAVLEDAQPAVVWDATVERCSIGSHPSNDVVIDDPTVSRFHCELRVERRGVRVRDLGSRNGTIVDGTLVVDAWIRPGSTLRLGKRTVRVQLADDPSPPVLSERNELGPLIGQSAAMRAAFAVLERVAATDATVLLEGETGTGKDAAAEAIHLASARRDRPLVVVDCASVPVHLLESQLFGHERGAFTGALTTRTGAFEEASRGTIFLDEIGELPAELQPKLLRVLERRAIQRIGANGYTPVDVRIIAATNRDLRSEVNAGRFRPDLYYRLAVVRVVLPPLRQRPDDIPMLVSHLLDGLGASADDRARLTRPDVLDTLGQTAWPGNVRELRNHLERCLVLKDAAPIAEAPASAVLDVDVPYAELRRRALAQFEARYVQALLHRHDDNVTQAARAAGIGRVYLYRLLRRHGLR